MTARHAAVGSHCAAIDIAEPNYLIPSSYGSFELKQSAKNEFIGQDIDYKKTKSVPLVSIDALDLKRLDFIKIDVEGMEEEVLKGAENSIVKFHPIMMIEMIKSDKQNIERFLQGNGYKVYPMGINLLAAHAGDPVTNRIKFENNPLWLG